MRNYRKTAVALTFVAFIVSPVFAQENIEAAKPPETVKVEEVTALKIENAGLKVENIALRIQSAQVEMRRLQAEQESIAKSAAEKAGLKWDEYDLDLGKRQFIRKKESAK